MTNIPVSAAPAWRVANAARELAPGLALGTAVAAAAVASAPIVAKVAPIPAMVIALFIGIALNAVAVRPAFRPGIAFAVKKLLRWAVALLGLRIGLGEIMALGVSLVLLVVAAMAVTVAAGLLFARLLGQTSEYGALAGAGTAVCGASATLATSTVLPGYPGKEADVVFVVAAVNALSTVAMVTYPPLCAWLGFDPDTTGAMLGGTIHDVAQVVGAGYAVSEPVGNAAVIVKLFRVFLLLPVVLAIGWCFARAGSETGEAKVPVPVFALVFLALCLVNSAMPSLPPLLPIYAPLKTALGHASTAGFLIAIAALGLSTSVAAMCALGWRHVAIVTGATVVMLAVVTTGLMALR